MPDGVGKGERGQRRPVVWVVVSLAAMLGLLLVTGTVASFRWTPHPPDWFERAEPLELFLSLSPEARASLDRHPRKRVDARLRHEGRDYAVRVRIKGHRSRRTLDDKPSLSLRFEDGGPGHEHFSRRRLTLNAMVEDPTSSREALAYQVHRALGLMAPRTAYALVSIDAEPRGAYLLVEAVDADLGRPATAGLGGIVYEGEYGCDLFPDDVDGFDLDAGEDPGRQRLRELTHQASRSASELFDDERGPLATSLVLRYLAVSAFIGDFDGYRHSHNYFLYQAPTTGKWQLVPWGLDRSLKKRLDLFDSQGWLARRCFSDPRCRLRYVREMQRVVDGFEALDLGAKARRLHAFVDSLSNVRAHSPHSKKRVDQGRLALLDFIAQRPAEVRRQLGCVDESGGELDLDGDGAGCMDCDDRDATRHPGAVELCDGVDDDCSGLPDDDPRCPCVAVEFESMVHEACNLPMPWIDARNYCQAKGRSLVRVVSEEHSRALYRAARELSDERWWIGYSDRAEEGNFVWTDGHPGELANWSRGQPDNGSCNQDCVALREDGGGRWQDTHCNQSRPFICGPKR